MILTLLKDTPSNPLSISQLLGGEHYEQPFNSPHPLPRQAAPPPPPPLLPVEPTPPGDGLGPIDFPDALNTPILCWHLTVTASDGIGGRDGEMGRGMRRTTSGWRERNHERGKNDTCTD